MKTFSVAIVGATGLVGSVLLSLLAERKFPVGKLHLLASHHSTGKVCSFRGEDHFVKDLASFDFHEADLSFFCIGGDLSAEYAPKAAACGSIVIDKSAHFRCQPDIPLIVPEVNLTALAHYHKRNIIAVPNCNTIPIAVALKPIYDAVGIHRINVATYQSVSGTGKEGVAELREQTTRLVNDQTAEYKVYSQQIAFNVLPHIDSFHENGYTQEEMKVVLEMRKIFADQTLAINPTAVRVPVYYGHAAAVHIETKNKLTVAEALKLLKDAPGVQLITGSHPYATPVTDAAGKDPVYVGRLREDISHEKGLNLWVVTDNLRKGAALNGVQIAEWLIKDYLSP